MKPRLLLPRCIIASLLLPALAPAQTAPVFQGLELVDEFDCSKTPPSADLFREYPANTSAVQEILKTRTRVLPNDKPGLKYFGYRLGRGKNLQAHAAYVLEVEYPEDAPRSMFILNQGAEVTRGFHTGPTIGDALKPRYVNNLPESLSLPLAGKFEKWQMLFHLHERFPDQLRPRDKEAPRTQRPEDGFWVFIAQFEPENAPLSQGAAVSKIRLYKAPSFETYALKVNPPPAGLPQRYIFSREEMADGVVGRDENERGLANMNDWFEFKARLFRFLGMNTFCKDMLEFGANQGWDSSKFGGDEWVFQSHDPQRWNRIVETAVKYNLSVLPYFEYSGSKGKKGLGNERRAKPLGNQDTYTHIKWTETARADLTDPDTYEDFRKMLEITIGDAKAKYGANFVGAWLRPRPSQLPISFSDGALERFTTQTKQSAPVTREMLRSDKKLYAAYKQWWFEQRFAFLNKLRDYVREASGNPDAVILYTADTTEPGRSHPNKAKSGLVAEDPELWAKAGHQAAPLKNAISEHWQLEALTLPAGTWGNWEWQHAAPEYDPQRYRANEGVVPTFSFNRSWTVSDSAALDAFRTKSGLAIVRHYSLNENMFMEGDEKDKSKAKNLFGYFVSDVELAGPFCMLAEARAVANGDPRYIGYLTSSSFNRGFPQYVRNFYAAFLSLPALPSERIDGVCADSEVAVRRINAGRHGAYFAVVNTGYTAKKGLALKLPDKGKVYNAATGEEVPSRNGELSVSLYPCQLVAVRVAP